MISSIIALISESSALVEKYWTEVQKEKNGPAYLTGRIFGASSDPTSLLWFSPAAKLIFTGGRLNTTKKILQMESTDFLNNFNQKIDLLYMDHLESGEKACEVHLQDSKIIIEKDLMNDDSIILVDDCPKNTTGKGKYSIPYLLDNGYENVLHEYQMVLKRSK